jgi:4-hydroxy-2-oxoheptanedioate aldolase
MKWDFIVLDMQHGAIPVDMAYQCVHIIRAAGSEAWIRVPIESTSHVQRALDIGAQTVVVPMVNSAQQAVAVASAAKYPPLGERSVGGDFAVHQGVDYPERANRETRLIVQIEHIQGVQDIDEIMAVPGVDGCFVGPTDLALSMGIARESFASDSRHRDAVEVIRQATGANKKIACCNVYSYADAQERIAAKWDCVTFKSDVDLLMTAGRNLLLDLRKMETDAVTTASK